MPLLQQCSVHIVITTVHIFLLQGGSEDVTLLNSVSRDNYTMLTFRRSLGSHDAFDTPISLHKPQRVFWSIGYKSPEMRRKVPPLKNKGKCFNKSPVY